MIGILSVGYGNIQSVKNVVSNLGFECVEVNHLTTFDHLTHLIIPGVGNFKACSDELQTNNYFLKIKDFIDSGRPLLGICLGMHMLMSEGEEDGPSKGVDYFQGKAGLLRKKQDAKTAVSPSKNNEMFILPHVGWNTVFFTRSHPIVEGIKNEYDFYFAHSYAVAPNNQEDILGVTTYGICFPSIIAKNNVVGIQFHPEKSLGNGKKIIENFCEWNGQC